MKLLITGGCSFSQVQGQPDPNLDEDKKVWPDLTWPVHLEEALKPEFHTHTGMAAAGNEIISQRIINKVNKALKDGFSPNDMLVGIMWSAADRFSLMSSNFKKNIHKTTLRGGNNQPSNQYMLEHGKPFLNSCLTDSEFKKWFKGFNTSGKRFANNPHSDWYNGVTPTWCAEVDDKNSSPIPTWYLLNNSWSDELTSNYFKSYVTPEYALLQTCNHILRTQWFLQSKGIKYFMTQMGPETFIYRTPQPHLLGESDWECNMMNDKEYEQWNNIDLIHEHPELNYLYDMIDKEFWLDVDNMDEWARKQGLPYRTKGDWHPSTAMHERFTKNYILPFILEKYNIS